MTKTDMSHFDLFRRGEYADHIQLSVTGDHNVSNALSAIAVADILGLSIDITKRGLLSFTGTDRRFEYKGEFNGVTVIEIMHTIRQRFLPH